MRMPLLFSLIPLTLTATAVLSQVPSTEQSLRQQVEAMLVQLDADEDGVVHVGELPPDALGQTLAKADTDADGVLSMDEALAQVRIAIEAERARRPQAITVEELMGELDSDGDGLVQVEEAVNEQMRAWIGRADTDGDGTMSLEELRTWVAQQQEIQRRGAAVQGIMRQFDADGDGLIHIATELPQDTPAAALAEADLNDDGSISPVELNEFAMQGSASAASPESSSPESTEL